MRNDDPETLVSFEVFLSKAAHDPHMQLEYTGKVSRRLKGGLLRRLPSPASLSFSSDWKENKIVIYQRVLVAGAEVDWANRSSNSF